MSESAALQSLLDRVHLQDERAREELVTRLYEQLQQRAHLKLRHERVGHSLGTTGLNHEALLRLWKNDEIAKAADINQLFRAFSRAMRQVLIDHARRRI